MYLSCPPAQLDVSHVSPAGDDWHSPAAGCCLQWLRHLTPDSWLLTTDSWLLTPDSWLLTLLTLLKLLSLLSLLIFLKLLTLKTPDTPDTSGIHNTPGANDILDTPDTPDTRLHLGTYTCPLVSPNSSDIHAPAPVLLTLLTLLTHSCPQAPTPVLLTIPLQPLLSCMYCQVLHWTLNIN